MNNGIFERAKIEVKENPDGGAEVEIDFATNADGKAFAQIVRERYGMKRYSRKAGGKFLADALGALKDEVDGRR